MSTLILKPVITEKSMLLAGRNVYTFEVPLSTNKIEIARAVKASFSVDATSVRIVVSKGKIKRFKGQLGRRVDSKKAMISVKAGQSIAIFSPEPEEATKESKKAKKPAKVVEGAK